MLSLEFITLMLSAFSSAFAFSYAYAFYRELLDGGTVNRIWLFASNITLTTLAFSSLARVLTNPLPPVVYYVSIALSGLIHYVAYVAHANQIALNHEGGIQTLPFNLHQKQWLMRLALFSSRHIHELCLALFIAPILVSVALWGMTPYITMVLASYLLNLAIQNDYVPHFLKMPYVYLCIALFTIQAFGITSVWGIALSTLSIGVMLFDYIQCNIRMKNSPTLQFPMTNPENKLTMEPTKGNERLTTLKLERMLNEYGRARASLTPHVTFDHFYQSHRITNQLLSNAPPVNYERYLYHFSQLDFNSPGLRDALLNEMAVHDKFNGKSLDEHRHLLNLPANSTQADIQLAYLRQEMVYFVGRLNNPSYRDLSHRSMAILHQYARLILNKIDSMPIVREEQGPLSLRSQLLLSLAIRTGSHCNRVYLDTLSELVAEERGLMSNNELTQKEEAILAAQTVRETSFRRYYYQVAPQLKEGSPVLQVLWGDLNDYHTYENFVDVFGSSFYLRNPSLTLRIRSPYDLLMEKALSYLFKRRNISFSDIYNTDYLVSQCIGNDNDHNNLVGYPLHNHFREWCERHFPDVYQDIWYDEDGFISNDSKLRWLAELMLIDYGIIGLSQPYIATVSFLDDLEEKKEDEIAQLQNKNEFGLSAASVTAIPGFFPAAHQQQQGGYEYEAIASPIHRTKP